MTRKTRSGHVTGGRVFGYAGRGSVATVLKRLCKAHKMPYHSSHKWGRHKMATRMGEAGHGVQAIQEAGGWDTARLVLDTYGHMDRKDVTDKMRALDKGLPVRVNNIVQLKKKEA